MGMAWFDYCKAYERIPHLWIIKYLDLFRIARSVMSFLKRSMMEWKTELISYRKSLGILDIRQGIFQGNSLSLLLLVYYMILLVLVLRKMNLGY